jgi:hypothetical protein
MLGEPEKAYLRECVNILSTKFLSDQLKNACWELSRAKVMETDAFLDDMQLLRHRCSDTFDELCKAIGDRQQIGVFAFFVPRKPDKGDLPDHVIGKEILVVTDKDEIRPRWSLVSFVST